MFPHKALLLKGVNLWYHVSNVKKQGWYMNKKQRVTLELIFKIPPPSNVRWDDIETLLMGLGAEITEGNGSRVRVVLYGVKAVFHRPHPKNETDKGALVSVRKFLLNAGINHDEI
jgi:HicA-like toxin of HicAB toxin-antitoxin system